MCFSVPMMFELIPFDCSQMMMLAEISAKWINSDYLSLTSFDFCKSLIAACSQDSSNYCLPHIRCIFKCMFVAYSQNVCGIFTAYLICCFESCSPHIR